MVKEISVPQHFSLLIDRTALTHNWTHPKEIHALGIGLLDRLILPLSPTKKSRRNSSPCILHLGIQPLNSNLSDPMPSRFPLFAAVLTKPILPFAPSFLRVHPVSVVLPPAMPFPVATTPRMTQPSEETTRASAWAPGTPQRPRGCWTFQSNSGESGPRNGCVFWVIYST